jgi:hypothetical protein
MSLAVRAEMRGRPSVLPCAFGTSETRIYTLNEHVAPEGCELAAHREHGSARSDGAVHLPLIQIVLLPSTAT